MALTLALACGDHEVHVPDLTHGQLCPRAIVETYTAPPDRCLRLDDQNGLTLFRAAESDDCGGPPCLRLTPGQTGYALEKIRPGTPAVWSFWIDSCDAVLFCPHSAVCDTEPERCGPAPNQSH
jgi:hypothetical protein